MSWTDQTFVYFVIVCLEKLSTEVDTTEVVDFFTTDFVGSNRRDGRLHVPILLHIFPNLLHRSE